MLLEVEGSANEHLFLFVLYFYKLLLIVYVHRLVRLKIGFPDVDQLVLSSNHKVTAVLVEPDTVEGVVHAAHLVDAPPLSDIEYLENRVAGNLVVLIGAGYKLAAYVEAEIGDLVLGVVHLGELVCPEVEHLEEPRGASDGNIVAVWVEG